MPDREKVIEYLAWAIAEAELTGHTSISLEPLRDALALLRAQMPRVMTLEEAREAIRDGGEDVIFWEEKMFYNPHRLSIGLRIPDNEITFPDGDYAEFDVLDDPEVSPRYGSLFRLWTSRPSEQQMRDTPWKGDAE